MTRGAIAALLALAACQEGARAGPPTCDDAGRAAIRMLDLRTLDATVDAAAARIAALCRDDRWPQGAITCVATLDPRGDRNKCRGMISDEQKAHLGALMQQLAAALVEPADDPAP